MRGSVLTERRINLHTGTPWHKRSSISCAVALRSRPASICSGHSPKLCWAGSCLHLPTERVLWDSRHVGGPNMETSDSSIPWLTPTCHQTLPSHPGATQPLSMKAELHEASLLQPNARKQSRCEEHGIAAPCQPVAKATSYALGFTKSSLLWGPRPRPRTAPCLATEPNRTVTTKKSMHTAKAYSPTPGRQQQTHSPGLPAARVAPPSPSGHSVQRLPARMTGSRPPRLW